MPRDAPKSIAVSLERLHRPHALATPSFAIYARTSPDCPISADEQVERLTAIACERRWTVVQAFTDRPATAKKDRHLGEMALKS
jgi:hypothetical protein